MVRQRAEWMRPVDDRLVEIFRSDEVNTPKDVEEVGICHAVYASNRARELARRGLLDRPSRGYYQTNEQGRAYLDGSLDASTLEPSGE